MEALLKYLPGPQPVAVRYSATTALVFAAYGVRLAVGDYTGAYGFLFFFLPIVASALMFDRSAGIFAVALSVFLVATLLDWSAKPGAHLIALLLFALVGACLVFIAEGLHRALETANAAQRATALLLEEMSHRVKNKFAMVSSIISLQARRSSPEARQALEDIASRVNIIATVHNYLQLSRHEGLIDMSEYLPKLCESLNDALLGPRAVSLHATAIPVELPPDKALTIGLIVNELVTNAIKYAFEEGQPGHVHVDLKRDEERFSAHGPRQRAGLCTDLGSWAGDDVSLQRLQRSLAALPRGKRRKAAGAKSSSNFRADLLTLAQPNLCFPQKPDDLFSRVPFPCHSLLSSIEVGNSRIRSINLVSVQGSRPAELVAENPVAAVRVVSSRSESGPPECRSQLAAMGQEQTSRVTRV